MIDQTVCALPKGNEIELVQLFGYTTKGIPGLDLVGLGQQGRSIKEKIIFLNKKLNLEVPKRRYLICLEDELMESLAKCEKRFIELPVWLLYLKLSGNLPIHSLKDVLSGGRIHLRGGVDCLGLKAEDLNKFNYRGLIPVVKKADENQRVIELPEIIAHLKLKLKT